MGLLVRGILRHKVHVSRVAVFVGTWRLSCSHMLQIEAIATTPFPRVVQVEHGHHLPLPHLHEQIVETCQDGVVVYARSHLQRGFGLRFYATLAIASHQNAKVVNPHAFHQVELAFQSLAVATLPFRTQNGTIPEVGSNEVIRLSTTLKTPVPHLHEIALRRYRRGHQSRKQKRQPFLHIDSQPFNVSK